MIIKTLMHKLSDKNEIKMEKTTQYIHTHTSINLLKVYLSNSIVITSQKIYCHYIWYLFWFKCIPSSIGLFCHIQYKESLNLESTNTTPSFLLPITSFPTSNTMPWMHRGHPLSIKRKIRPPSLFQSNNPIRSWSQRFLD